MGISKEFQVLTRIWGIHIGVKGNGIWRRNVYEKSLKIEEELGNKQGISNSYNSLGDLYQDKGEWDKALKCFEKSLKVSEELGDKNVTSNSYNNLGDLYWDKGNGIRRWSVTKEV